MDAKNAAGDRTTSVGDLSGQTLSQFLVANPTATAKLWMNLSTNALIGSFALETIRCGNEGVIQEDAGSGTGYGFANPAAGITGSAQPWAWNAGGPPYVVNGQLKNLVPGPQSTSWIAAGTTSSHYVKQFTIGQPIEFGTPTNPNGYDPSMASGGGEAWALACLLGFSWSQNETNMAHAATAGQIVNNTTGNMATGAAVLLSVANYIGPTNPRNGVVGNWYAVPLSADLVASLATDSATKALLFNNWFAGTATGGSPSFVAKEQGDGTGRAFLEITPGPATLSVLPLGGLASSGYAGGPFSPSTTSYTLTNIGALPLSWTAGNTQPWITLDNMGGTLAPGDSATVTVSINIVADSLLPGTYSDTVTFTNSTNGIGNTTRSVSLTIPIPPGDVNGDGHVDVVDLLWLVDAFGTCTNSPNWNPACDLNSDGYVNNLDRQILMNAYGTSQGQPNYNPACDFNGDGNVDSVDLGILQAANPSYGGDPNYNPACDFNSDGYVDVIDLLTLVENFGL